MNDYEQVRLTLTPCTEDATDLLAALLADEGYESFVPDAEGVTAYVRKELFDAGALSAVIDSFPMPCDISVQTETVEGRDWNAEWEKNYFQPIVVAGECVIHSTFHTDVPQARYDIVIDPKMAFGTGHHATTSQVIARLLALDLNGATVIDIGTGTGILAILAAMRGASRVVGIEIDAFAHENALENCRLNGHPEIEIILGDASALENAPVADVLVANINRNIITADLAAYRSRLRSGGTMILSGFYESDIPVIMAVAEPLGLRETLHTTQGDNWACLQLQAE